MKLDPRNCEFSKAEFNPNFPGGPWISIISQVRYIYFISVFFFLLARCEYRAVSETSINFFFFELLLIKHALTPGTF